MELREVLAGLSPDEQTEWVKAHMPNWDEFIEGIRVSRQQLAEHRATGQPR